jgi:hypothetical protein
MDKEAVKKAIKEFNEKRSPEMVAKIEKQKENLFTISFSGPFCRSCAFDESFEDLRLLINRKGLKAKINKFRETNDRNYLVEYEIKE